jgi:hypothetical protein
MALIGNIKIPHHVSENQRQQFLLIKNWSVHYRTRRDRVINMSSL